MKEFQLLGEMTYEYNADDGLSYASPVRGVWNIVHIGTLLPECHQVYVCPTSCLRGVVLTTAEMGAMDRLSTITVGEDNLLDGDMEEALQRGVERIIAELPRRPKAILIFVSCVHHFLAVNYKRVYRVLEEKYPDIDFVSCYMDPIMRRVSPVVPNLWRQMFRPLKPTEHTGKTVNYIGNCFPYQEHCDLTEMLKQAGVEILDIVSLRSYDQFKRMAASPVNFSFHNAATFAGKDLQIRLGQQWVQMRAGYSYDEIDREMKAAATALSIAPPSDSEIAAQRTLTEAAVAEAKAVIGETPISIDYTAVDKPLELALFLLRHGFCVESIFIDVFTESLEIFEQLQATAPDLKIYQSFGWNIRQMHRYHEGKVVSIGQKSAYFLNNEYFVNVVDNEGMYGYRGIRRLMALLTEAAQAKKPMKDLVQIKGWGCNCC